MVIYVERPGRILNIRSLVQMHKCYRRMTRTYSSVCHCGRWTISPKTACQGILRWPKISSVCITWGDPNSEYYIEAWKVMRPL